LYEYFPSKAPLPSLSVPAPSFRSPRHSASEIRFAIVHSMRKGNHTASRGVHRDAHDELDEIMSVKHANKRFGRVLQAIYDVFAIANAAVGDAGADFAQEIGVILRGKIVVDEPAQGQALRHDLAHRRREAVGSII